VLKTGVEAPAFSLKAIDGATVELAGLRGKHVLVLFWAAWHKGSVSVLKEADELSRDFKARGLEVVALSLDDEAELDAVKKAVADGKIRVKVALCGDETYGAYWVSRVPTYVLVDPAGKALSSEAEPKDLGALRKMLEEALAK
jgi:peroxiredoxin